MAALGGVSPTMQWTQGQGYTFDQTGSQQLRHYNHEPRTSNGNNISKGNQLYPTNQDTYLAAEWADAQAAAGRSVNAGAGAQTRTLPGVTTHGEAGPHCNAPTPQGHQNTSLPFGQPASYATLRLARPASGASRFDDGQGNSTAQRRIFSAADAYNLTQYGPPVHPRPCRGS